MLSIAFFRIYFFPYFIDASVISLAFMPASNEASASFFLLASIPEWTVQSFSNFIEHSFLQFLQYLLADTL